MENEVYIVKQFRKLSMTGQIVICIVLSLATIILTRALTITHNFYLHPDEYVYYFSVKNMVNYLQGDIPVMVYPEGAFTFQLPFQLIFRAFSMKDVNGLRMSGRAAGVFYFTIGAFLGFLVLNKCFGKNLRTSLIYGATMVFSLFHVEQSRYGTSETLIFLFLMLTILLSAYIYDGKGKRILLLIFEGMACGILASMKYPLLYFCLFPVFAAVRTSRRIHGKLLSVVLVLASVAAGFFIVSPKTLLDFSYVSRAIDREWKAYVGVGNLSEVGGWYNHILSVLVYATAYAGLLGGPFLAYPLFRNGKKEGGTLRKLWQIDMPLIILVFFTYNLFSKTVFLRNYYPFFCVLDIYACAGLSFLTGSEKRRKKCLAIVLLALTVLRGGFLIGLMTDHTSDIVLQKTVPETVDKSWSQTTFLGPGRNYLLPFNKNSLKNLTEIDIDNRAYSTPESLIVRPGELVITAPLDYSKCSPYMLPISVDTVNMRIDRWDKFKTINRDYCLFQPYPEWYYSLFGYWVKGTTGTDYEFPTNYIYYRPANP